MKPEQVSKRVARAAPTLLALTLALASTLVLTLSGCASSAGITSSARVLAPESLGLQPGGAAAADVQPVDEAWRSLGDPQLLALIAKALDGSPSLRLAQTRIERAQAVAAGVQAGSGLQVNGSADLTRQHFSANSIYPPPLGGSVRTLVNTQIGATWEYDFFGRNRAALQAALGASRAAEAEAQAARALLASNVARSYVQLGRLQAQREVAQRALQQRDALLALIRQRVQAGLDTTVELRQGEGALPETRQQIEQLDEQITLTRHALAAATAQAPAALDTLVVRLQDLKPVPVPAAIPADLLGRRADISAARWRIEAAGSDVQAARAAFYPNINLAAFAGLASIGLDRLVQASSEQYGAGPALRLPIFDAGRLRANLRGKTADLDAAIESCNAAVLEALHEAADPIAALPSIQRQQREQAQAQAAAESAFDLATQRFRAGLSTYVTVLNAESGVLAQRRLAVDLQARALDKQLLLALALGGGFSAPSPTAADTTSLPSGVRS